MSGQSSYVRFEFKDPENSSEKQSYMNFFNYMEQFRMTPDIQPMDSYMSYQKTTNSLILVIRGHQYLFVSRNNNEQNILSQIDNSVNSSNKLLYSPTKATIFEPSGQKVSLEKEKTVQRNNQLTDKSLNFQSINIEDDIQSVQNDQYSPIQEEKKMTPVIQTGVSKNVGASAKKSSKKVVQRQERVQSDIDLLADDEQNSINSPAIDASRSPKPTPKKTIDSNSYQADKPIYFVPSNQFTTDKRSTQHSGSLQNEEQKKNQGQNKSILKKNQNLSQSEIISPKNRERSTTPEPRKITPSKDQGKSNEVRRSRTPDRFTVSRERSYSNKSQQDKDDIDSNQNYPFKRKQQHRRDENVQIQTQIFGLGEEFDRKILLHCMEFGFSQTRRKFKDQCNDIDELKIAQIYRSQHKNYEIVRKKQEILKKTSNNMQYINNLIKVYRQHKQTVVIDK